MTSFFQYARQTTDEDPIADEDIAPVFEDIKSHKKQNIIPPIGLAKPELVQAFEENVGGDEQKILDAIAESEAYERENPLETGTRETLAHGARGLEGFLGGISGWLNMLTPELYQDENGMPYTPGEEPEGFPSAEKLHGITKSKTGKYLEPKTKRTVKTQETASDIGSMLSTPGLGLLQKFVIPVAGNIFKDLLKTSGVDEAKQDMGKAGFMVLSTIAGNGNAPQVARNAMAQARAMIPQGLSFSARPTERALNQLRNQPWFRTGTDATKAPAMQMVERIENQIQNGMIDGQVAMQLRIDLNRARRQLGGFQLNPVPDRAAARHYLDQVDNALVESMENYGTRANPEWWRNYQRANQAFAVTERSRAVSDFMQQYAKPVTSDTAKVLFNLGGTAAVFKAPALLGAAVPVAATVKTIQIMNRMIRSHVLRNHYIDVLRASATGNAQVMNKALQKFDKEAKKYENPDIDEDQ